MMFSKTAHFRCSVFLVITLLEFEVILCPFTRKIDYFSATYPYVIEMDNTNGISIQLF